MQRAMNRFSSRPLSSRPLGPLALALAVGAAGFAAPAPATAGSFNVEFLDQLVLGPPETVTDVDVAGGLAFVGRGAQGLTIVDVSNPRALRVIGEFNLPGQLIVNDVQVDGDRVYLTNESYMGVAVYILDVSVPAVPQVIGAIIQPLLNSCHNLWADGDILYTVGHGTATGWRTRIFDVSNPLVPILLVDLGNSGAHDITLRDRILYEAGGWSGLHLWDVSNPAQPVLLASADENQGPRPHYHSHSAWPTEDGQHVIVMNEIESWWGGGQIFAGGVKIWGWDGAGQLALAATWRPEVAQTTTLIAAHNVVVRGRYAYLSYYQAGLRVLDVADPAHPVEVAFYDTYPGLPTALFQGAWGVDLLPGESPAVLVSDRVGGLFALRPKAVTQARFAGSVVAAATGEPIPGAVLHLVTAERTAIADADGEFTILTGEGRHEVEVSAFGFVTAHLDITLTSGNDSTPLRIELEAKNFATGVPAAVDGAPAPRLALGSASPNPFQESTRIAYTLGSELVGARLMVHDVAGRVVRELPVTNRGQQVVWDGRDGAGRRVPTGVYHLRLSTGGEVRTARVVRVD
jgi:choice-of-anchor B domain-containing protein